MAIPTVGAPTPRLDVEVHAGAPLDFSVPVLDDDTDTAVSSLAGWTVTACAAPSGAGPVDLAATIEGTSVRIRATASATRAWAAWPSQAAPWDVVLTDPLGDPRPPLCAGWIRIHATIPRQET